MRRTLAGSQTFFQQGRGVLLPFTEQRISAVGANQIYVGASRDSVVYELHSDGTLVPVLRLGTTAKAPTGTDLRFAKSWMDEMFWKGFGDAAPWPDQLPIFEDILVASDEKVWVQLYRTPLDPFEEWLVFTPVGDLVGTFRMDGSLYLLDAGTDYVMVLSTDDIGLQEVRLHRLLGTNTSGA